MIIRLCAAVLRIRCWGSAEIGSNPVIRHLARDFGGPVRGRCGPPVRGDQIGKHVIVQGLGGVGIQAEVFEQTGFYVGLGDGRAGLVEKIW